MLFPNTNKHRNSSAPVEGEFGDNLKELENRMKQVDWRYIGYAYAIGFSIFIVSIFILLVTVRAAFHIF